MNGRETKSVVTQLFQLFAINIPSWAAKQITSSVEQSANKHAKLIVRAVSFISAITAFLLAQPSSKALEHLPIDNLSRLPIALVSLYLIYVTVTLPFFMMTTSSQRFSGDQEIHDKKRKRRQVSQPEIEKAMERAQAHETYLGSSFWSGRPFYLTDEMRFTHAHVVGSTGVGKTESVLLPLLKRDIERGSGAIILDAKGDLELLARIRYFVEVNQRKRDFLFFSLSHPEISNTYNPLLRGNASEIKDKLIGSTEWREEFYRKKAEEAALTLLRAFNQLQKRVTFRELYDLLTNKSKLSAWILPVTDNVLSKDLEVMKNSFHDNVKFLSGFIADLGLISKSEFSALTDTERSQIDLLDVYRQKKIVYFSLNTQGYEETAKRFGRLILQDIKTVSNHVQSQMEETERHFFPVYVDEFSSFVYENFIEFLNKARGAKFAVTLLHQSLADLAAKRTTFQQQILENTNIKIIMRQDDPYSIDKYSKMGGSKRTLISTYQTEERMLGTNFTGKGSVREAQTFRIDPDLVRSLGRGEAIVVTKFPRFQIDYLKLSHEANMNLGWIHHKINDEKEQARRRSEESLKAGVNPFANLFNAASKFEEQQKNEAENNLED